MILDQSDPLYLISLTALSSMVFPILKKLGLAEDNNKWTKMYENSDFKHYSLT
jgi:hypothetical protein